MAENLKRVTAKIFAGNASENMVGQFGSALIGTKNNTTDVETIQALPAYTIGWSSAVLTNKNYPTLEEMNGVMKNMSYQTAYNMQKGVAEWDEKTTYFAGDICKAVGQGVLYFSRVDNNVGHDVSETDYWSEYTGTSASIPATNYIATMAGDASYADDTLTLPSMAGYAPNGRNLDGTLKSLSVALSGAYKLTGSGSYYVFYNDKDKNLILANEYFKFINEEPNTNVTNNVWWNSDTNETSYVISVLPNYVISDGVNVTDDGIVSNLGTLTASASWDISKTSILNLSFTTGADVTTEQSLFNIPFAKASIKDGNINIDLYSSAYAVSYGEQIYNGAYTLEATDTTYQYNLGGTTVYSASSLANDVVVYTNEDKTQEYGTVIDITSNTCIIQKDDEQVYSGEYSLTDIINLYTYSLGGTNYYCSQVLAQNVILYTDNTLTTAWGTVASVTDGNVMVINGVNIGYVSTIGTGLVPTDIIIYSDVDCTTQIEISTGSNATYLGEISKSKVGTITYAVTASTAYTGTLSYANDTYNITLNDEGSNLISSRLPYSYSTTIMLGGNNSFLGTFNLMGTFVTGVWLWNNYIDGDTKWETTPLLYLGELTMEDNKITDIHIHKPIALAQMSDLENSANVELSNTQRLSNCILSYTNPVTYENNVTTATFTLPVGYKVLFANGRNTTDNTVESIEKTVQEALSLTVPNIGTTAGVANVLYLQLLNNALSLTWGNKALQIIADETPLTSDTQTYFWLNQAQNLWYTGNSTEGWTRTTLIPVAEYTSTDTNIITSATILPPLDLNSSYINRNGDTTTGLITFQGYSHAKACFKSNDGIINTAIPSTIYDDVRFVDKYGRRTGAVETIYGADGSRSININIVKDALASEAMRLLVGYDANGNPYTEAPTPATEDRSTKIATTAFVGNVVASSAIAYKASNGYIKFSNGIIIQWGRSNKTSTGDTTVTFPIAFTMSTPQIVVSRLTQADTTTVQQQLLVRSSPSSTQFKWYNNVSSGTSCMWVAMGY